MTMINRGELAAIGVFLTLFALFSAITPAPLSQDPPFFPHLDKLYHFGFYLAYFLTIFLLGRKSGLPFASSCMVSLFFVIALGSFEEALQSVTPGRHMDALDLLADVTGALTGLAILLYWRIIKPRLSCIPCFQALSLPSKPAANCNPPWDGRV